MMRAVLIAAVLIATPALAQTPAAPSLSQLLPTLPVPPVDPARVPPARLLAAKVIPDGTFRKLMGGSVRAMMDGMFSRMMDLPAKQLLKSFDLPDQDTAKVKDATLRQIMEIVDPAYQQRMKITTTTMLDGLTEIYATIEPDVREGLAQAYAARFDVTQLDQLNTFFSTPTGAAFAGQQMTVMTEPAVLNKMQSIMPAIMKQMPAFMGKMGTATASLPKPKTAADLTDADRAKLAKLLGVTPDTLKAKGVAK